MPKFRKGFTLIELLVVITIIGILAGVGFANYQTFAATQTLNDAVSQMQSLIREAQTNATASVICNGSQSKNWQIVFSDKTHLELRCFNSTTPLKTYALPANVSMGSISGGTCTPSSVTVAFAVLSGDVTFGDPSNCTASATGLTVPVTFSGGGNNFVKNITVSKGGGIDVH